jgi:hypothetical protein
MVLIGNPFSGVGTGPELLPQPVGAIGQLLPPGAGGNLLRSTAFFDGAGGRSRGGARRLVARRSGRPARRAGALGEETRLRLTPLAGVFTLPAQTEPARGQKGTHTCES